MMIKIYNIPQFTRIVFKYFRYSTQHMNKKDI